MRKVSQNTIKPEAPAGMINELFASSREEKESLKKLWSSRPEKEDLEIINISMRDNLKF
jgi:hypothetical protein